MTNSIGISSRAQQASLPVSLADLHRFEHVPVRVAAAGGLIPVGVHVSLAGVLEIRVLVELQPQAVERLRAVVAVGDDLITRESGGNRVETGVDHVVGAVLPVSRTRRAVTGAINVDRIGQSERRETRPPQKPPVETGC